ncbi:MAG: hypothetical protein V7K89_23580 [Nostoc sp.]|uniref:hypothetical protein n=1 Tax=Nostoc sp. TaxID=1180 RepID=UPI002FF6DC51
MGARRHHEALVVNLQLPLTRFPSDSTFRRVIMGIDFTDLAKVFNNWVNDWMPTQELDWLGVDGKSIKATVSNYDQVTQDFINVVSIFNTRCGVAIAVPEKGLLLVYVLIALAIAIFTTLFS